MEKSTYLKDHLFSFNILIKILFYLFKNYHFIYLRIMTLVFSLYLISTIIMSVCDIIARCAKPELINEELAVNSLSNEKKYRTLTLQDNVQSWCINHNLFSQNWWDT